MSIRRGGLLSRYTAVEIRQIRLTKLHIFSYSSGANTTVEMPFAAHSTGPETSIRWSACRFPWIFGTSPTINVLPLAS